MKKGGTILIILLCVINIGLIGFFVWDKLINIQKSDFNKNISSVKTNDVDERKIANDAKDFQVKYSFVELDRKLTNENIDKYVK